MSGFSRRVSAYSLGVAVSAVSGLMTVPVLLLAVGPEAWSFVALSQSVAGLIAVFIDWGWGVVGPARTATLNAEDRGRYFAQAVVVRVALFAALAPAAAIVAAILSKSDPFVYAFICVGYLLPSLNASWFFVGESQPWRYLWIITMPRAIALVAGSLLSLVAASLVPFATVLILGGVLSAVLSVRSVMRRYATPWRDVVRQPQELRAVVARQLPGLTTTSTSALYVAFPTVFLGWIFPQALAPYALADKLVRFALAASMPVIQVLQGWVPQRGFAQTVSRATKATTAACLIGAGGAGLAALLLPPIGSLFSSGEVTIPWSMAIAQGLTVGSVFASQVVGLACLIALGKDAWVARSTVLGAVVGVPLAVMATLRFEAVGMAWAVAVSESLVLAVQLAVLIPILRGRR